VTTSTVWRSLNKSELTAAGLLIALGAYVAWEAWEWPYMTKDGPGPGFFPLWIGILLVGLAALLIVLQVADASAGKPVEKTSWAGTRPALVGWGALLVAALLLEPAGFVASYLFLSVVLLRVSFRRSWSSTALVSVVSVACFWGLFVKLLEVRLPVGPWGF
jgi:putative tricarboxylic transport membrane protein